MQEYNNREPARLVANKETGHNIYDIKRGKTYRNINTELITVIPRTNISRKLQVKNKDTISTQ